MFYFGFITFALALLSMLAALGFSFFNITRKERALSNPARMLGMASFILHTLSVLSLLLLQVQGNFQIAYIASVTNTAMPLTLKLTALWGGQAGSLFFWTWIVNLCLFIALVSRRHLLDGWSFLLAGLNVLFFGVSTFFMSNPFNRVWELADGRFTESLFLPEAGAVLAKIMDGNGLNPLLRHPAMVIHPPLLYLGYGLFLIPFSIAVSKLIRGDRDENLLDHTRGWILAAWVMLSAGLALGSWWAYNVLGWGGYWAWDPVETASLLPWLASTGLLHSLLLQRKRHIFQRFNLLLVLLAWFLVVFSIFVTRSGIINSVHAFGQSSISKPFAIYTLLTLLLALALLIWRWGRFAAEWEFNSPFAREALFLYTNVILLALVAVCLWGLAYPIFTGLFQTVQVNLDKAYFQRVTGPLFIILVLLMAVCPLLGWTVAGFKKLGKALLPPLALALLGSLAAFLLGVTSPMGLLGIFLVLLGLAVLVSITLRDAHALGLSKFFAVWWKQRARYGAYLVHAGILLIALGITGVEVLAAHQQGVIQQGERMPIGSHYELEFVQLRETWTSPEYKTVKAETIVYRDGIKVAELEPGQDVYLDRGERLSVPANYSTLRGDLYTQMVSFDAAVPYIAVTAADNPLVPFLWVGSFLLVFGGLLAMTLLPKPEPSHASP
ncbi:MAG: cytochrome c-type biogenesis CcmF C-terminal domain-containing protein [Anaerolineaceae bacterium]|nr:cytochrome c-type biogenesis CcmF C-terminal domain-containing protein [Anaerolineaceae bacterium]